MTMNLSSSFLYQIISDEFLHFLFFLKRKFSDFINKRCETHFLFVFR